MVGRFTNVRTVAAVVVIAALFAGTLAAKTLLFGGASTVTPPTLIERNVLKLLNVQRAKYHLPVLHYDSTLAKYARAHTRDMLRNDYFQHDAPDGGQTYVERMQPLLHAPGRNRLEENIEWASGSALASSLVSGWMHSPEHRANILNPQVHRSGQGITVGPFQGQVRATVATSEFSN
jgi:uncharacterized protein YkwD